MSKSSLTEDLTTVRLVISTKQLPRTLNSQIQRAISRMRQYMGTPAFPLYVTQSVSGQLGQKVGLRNSLHMNDLRLAGSGCDEQVAIARYAYSIFRPQASCPPFAVRPMAVIFRRLKMP